MAVNSPLHFGFGRTAPSLFLPVLLAICAVAPPARAENPNSATNSFYGSVTAQPVTSEPLKLSLDDAIQRGLKNNLGLREAEKAKKCCTARKRGDLQEFLPTITLTGDTGYLHARPGGARLRAQPMQFRKVFSGGRMPAGLSNITRDDLTEGQIHFSQILFSGPVIAGLEGGGRGGTGGVFHQDVGARRGGAASGDGLSARHCRREPG